MQEEGREQKVDQVNKLHLAPWCDRAIKVNSGENRSILKLFLSFQRALYFNEFPEQFHKREPAT